MSFSLAAGAAGDRTRFVSGEGGVTKLLLAVAFGLALAGLGVAGYLTFVHYAHQSIACNGLGDCEYVNNSEYAKVVGVPVALMGAVAYATIGVLSAVAWLRREATLLLAAWLVALASVAFSMYLTYIELRVLMAICVYCVVSATIMMALFATLTALAWRLRVEIADG